MYTSRSKIENYLLMEVEPWFTSQVDEWINQMSRLIDRKTNRTFIADTEASARLYDGTGTAEIVIDEFVELDTLKIQDREIDDYLLYPANMEAKHRILVPQGIPRGAQIVEATAKWGYSVEVPPEITFACTVLVAGIINASYNHEGEVQSETIGRYSVTYKTDKQVTDFETAKDILKQYRRITF